MMKKNVFFLMFFTLFLLVGTGLLFPAVTPNSGNWSGTTGSGKEVSFEVLSPGTKWDSFKFTFSWSGGYISGTTSITTYGPANITNGMFSYSSSTYGFTGQFNSTSTASGTYTLNNFKITHAYGYVLVSGWGTWTATGPADPLQPGPPFGTFETPIDGSTVMSSIAVTGWVLDDTGIASVKIYRKSGKELVYIGDAVLVEGARPDVAAAYPQYPNNTKAGWGYMMLTNFLPNGGNGTFEIHAIATDTSGTSTTLGTKTIYCDNAHAVKPFGAIDTPGQGGTASGSSFINWGWALTPQPNSIPTDGSTINVYVDGVNIGHPTYNIYRSDIATFFPFYANTNGAAGYFYLDTTGYADGVHTIQWTAKDSGNNTDGIGSRYFTISNSGGSALAKTAQHTQVTTVLHHHSPLDTLPNDRTLPVNIKKGFDEDIEPLCIESDQEGITRIELEELERLEIQLSNPISGCMIVDKKSTPLPIGSTLDLNTGKFSWLPGPGFLGNFRLTFVEEGLNGQLNRRDILVTIAPKSLKE